MRGKEKTAKWGPEGRWCQGLTHSDFRLNMATFADPGTGRQARESWENFGEQRFMATKKRSKNNSKNNLATVRKKLQDERVPKLLGLALWLLGLYLFIAFTSYLFTWQEDQDEVLRFSWSLLFQSELSMANWLGRLGAIVSNLFFYWGFGLSSFFIIGMLYYFGKALIQGGASEDIWPRIRLLLVLLIFTSILLEFFFPGAAFPVGGAFGEYFSQWLENFLGKIGVILLLLFVLVALLVWLVNPNFQDKTIRELVEEFRLGLQERFTRPRRQPPPAESAPEPLRPRRERTQPPESGEKQLALDFDAGKREKPTVIQPGKAELEIETPPAQEKPQESIELEEQPFRTAPLGVEQGNAEHLDPYDPTLELSSYEFPVMALLDDYENENISFDRAELEANKDQIIETLLNYKIEIIKIRATIGPTVTLYEIVPAPGVRISKIKNLEDDIALSLSALGIRIIAPIPGKGTIGIEVPNKRKQTVGLKEVLLSDKFRKAKMDLPIALGKTISNDVFVADLAKMPHLLIAGATGQGKSVGINTILMSLLYKKHPSQLKLVLIDPKKVELFPYSKLEQHFLAILPDQDEPITTETTKVVNTLNSLCIEMDRRYNLLKKAHARNIKEYNDKFIKRQLNPNNGHRFLPFIVLVIDEFADLIMTAGKEVELPLGRLAQLARAVGIHLIIATQRPSVNIITGVIKANFPARIAYKVTAKVDSRTILDQGGAEQLIGRGDMLLSVGGEMKRLQCAFVDTPEVERVINFIAQQPGYPEPYFLPEFHSDDEDLGGPGTFSLDELDDMWEEAARLVVQRQHGSTSMIQRRLSLGYNRAGRIMDQLEALGIVGPAEGSKPREVLIYDESELERILEDIKNRK